MKTKNDMGDFNKIYSSLILEDEEYKLELDINPECNLNELRRIEDEVLELERLGFQNTLNSRDLTSIKEKLNENKDNSANIDLYNKVRSAFPDALIIPNDKFDKILDDNNLVVRTTKFYIGSVPLSVLNKAKDHLKRMEDFLKNESNFYCFRSKRVLYKEFKYNRLNLFKSELNLVINNLRKSVVFYNYDSNFTSLFIKYGYKKNNAETIDDIIRRNSKYDTEWSGSGSLFIACPESMSKPVCLRDDSIYDLNAAQAKLEKSKALDPILFQYTKVGVLVIDSWGKESHSEILLEHRDKLNLNES